MDEALADAAPEQALKLVTVLFLDVVGSTQLSQHLDPEDIQGRPEAALFGTPDGQGGFTPLPGDYRMEVRIAVADPTDTIAVIAKRAG